MALSTIAAEQSKVTEFSINTVKQLFHYCAMHWNAKIWYEQLDMILNIYSDASYLGAPKKFYTAGHFFLGWQPQDKHPMKLNWPIHVCIFFLQFVHASTAEAVLGALFVNANEGKIICVILEEMGHPQQPTPFHCDNSTITRIAIDSVKKQHSCSIEMQ